MYNIHHTTHLFTSANSGMPMIHIGKDMQHVPLPKMVSVNMYYWGKAISFGTVRDSVYSLLDALSVADVMSLVSNKLSLDNGTVFQEV